MGSETIEFSKLFSTPQKNGLTRPKRVRGAGLPMVNMGELFSHSRISNVEMDLVPISDREDSFFLQSGDLLFARQSLVLEGAGKCSIFVENKKPTVFESHIIRCRLDTRKADPSFYYYFFQSPQGRSVIEQIVEQGAGAAGIRGSDLARLSVPYPEIRSQRSIASVLSALDDRIDNLHQTSATLESIAQTLFKSWFVDFEPVRAKAEGREPEGMDATTASLFPSELENSELGPIPKGWRTESFEREFDFTMGQSPPGSTYNQDGVGVPFFQGSTDFGDVFPAERVFCIQPTRLARAGDLLMSVRAPVGALNIANIECSIGRGLCAIRHKSGSTAFTQQYVQACLARIENAAGEGALFKSLSKKQLAELPVVVANSPVVDAMISLLEPLAARRIVGARQAQRFAQLRDTLLPRLISGKLRLPEAIREIDAATA